MEPHSDADPVCGVGAAPECSAAHHGGEGPCEPCARFLEELDHAEVGRRWFGYGSRAPVLPGLVTTLENAVRRAGVLMSDVIEQAPGPYVWTTKAIACGGVQTVSGFHPILDGASHAPPTLVRLVAHKIGHRLTVLESYDCIGGAGWPGYYHAAHAEKQLAVVAPDEPLGVSRRMCGDCRNFFRCLAVARRHVQIVLDPCAIHFFFADGSVRDIKRPWWLARR